MAKKQVKTFYDKMCENIYNKFDQQEKIINDLGIIKDFITENPDAANLFINIIHDELLNEM